MEHGDPHQRSVDPRQVFRPVLPFREELEQRLPSEDFQVVDGVGVQVVAENVADPPLPAKTQLQNPTETRSWSTCSPSQTG